MRSLKPTTAQVYSWFVLLNPFEPSHPMIPNRIGTRNRFETAGEILTFLNQLVVLNVFTG